jgi:hypothetical protein
LGFDGSENNDYTAIQAETFDGFSFTPRYGPDNCRRSGTRRSGMTRSLAEVHAAVDEIFSRYRVERMYCDPQDWRTEIGEWSSLTAMSTCSSGPRTASRSMFEEIKRFEIDLAKQAHHP